MQNPLRTEAAMFRLLIWVLGFAAAVVVIAVVIRAVS
jgi:hypothetical protein